MKPRFSAGCIRSSGTSLCRREGGSANCGARNTTPLPRTVSHWSGCTYDSQWTRLLFEPFDKILPHRTSSRVEARWWEGQWLPSCQPFRASWQNGHQTVHSVSSTPSKIRTAGFPRTGFKRAVSGDLHGPRHLYAATVEISPGSVYSVVGLSPKRHAPSLTRLTRPVALGSASGCSVRQPHCLLRPHPSLWPSAPAYGLYPARSRTPEVPQFTPRAYLVRVVSRTPAVSTAALDCCFTVDAAFAAFASARQPHRQTVRSGLNSVTRLENSLHATTRSHCWPCPGQGFYDRAFAADVATRPRRLCLSGFQSIPAAGLSPARLAALWAASKERRDKNLRYFFFASFVIFVVTSVWLRLAPLGESAGMAISNFRLHTFHSSGSA